MIEPRHLNNAPIVEAVIDLAVIPAPDFTIERLFELKQKMPDYPQIKEVHQNIFKIVPNQPVTSSANVQKCGYVFTSKDNFYVAQMRPDEFIFSRLKPYSSWEEFRDEARRIWEFYVAAVKPTIVNRITLRYINQLKLPLPAEFENYFSVPPRIPEGMPNTASNFFSQIVVEDIQNKASTMIVQFTQPLVDQAFLTAILDIVSYRQGDFSIDSDKIWGTLEILRNAKNHAFFGSITEKTLKLFE